MYPVEFQFVFLLYFSYLTQISTPTHIEEHGFARNMLWKIEDNPCPIPTTSNTAANNTAPSKNASVDIILKTSENWNNR